MSLEAKSNDGKNHSVQVYSDTTSGMHTHHRRHYHHYMTPMLLIFMFIDWLSADDRNETASWELAKTDKLICFEHSLQAKAAFAEKNDQALDGTAYFGMVLVSSQSLKHNA
jgi:hypothetical protein